MELIIKFKAKDGVEFSNESDCLAYEDQCGDIDAIIAILPEKPDTCDFSNGGGYVQHSMENFMKARNAYLEYVKIYTDHDYIQQTIDKGLDVHPSWVARISEFFPGYVAKKWHRFQCVDDQLREWGQPYYANNPEDAEQKRLK